jgi:hypothetical protein
MEFVTMKTGGQFALSMRFVVIGNESHGSALELVDF